MHLAYLVNQYPAVSHTFIRREILSLEQLGHTVERYSIRDMSERVIDPQDVAEAKKTKIVLEFWPCLTSIFRTATLHPWRFVKALRDTFALAAPSDRGLLRHMAYLAEACRLLELLRRGGATHLHAHFGTNSTAVAMLCRSLGGPPFSFTVHGPEEFYRPEAEALARKVSAAAFVVAISSFGRSQLRRWLPLSEWPKVHVVRCGIDASLVASEPAPFPEKLRFVCIGRLSEAKGHFVLVEAAQRLINEGLPLELILVGDGPLRSALEERIRVNNLSEHIRLVGSQSGDQVRQWLDSSRGLVMASFAEGLPVVVMEAFARGRPVVATYVAGMPELVVPGKNGWLVPAASADLLADAVSAASLASVETLAAMGLHGRTMVLDLHSVDKESKRLANLFLSSNERTM